MGCEDRVRVARNVRAEEESTGLLGGSTAMTHTVSIEVSSSLGQPIQIDVLDRMPVSEDKGLTVEMVYENRRTRRMTRPNAALRFVAA